LRIIETGLAAAKTDVRATEPPIAPQKHGRDPAALAVVAQAIASAIERGAPFPKSLAAAQALGAQPEQLALLRAVADKGAPTAASLAAAFAGVAQAALAAAQPPLPPDAGLMDRLGRLASSLVRVRPAGDTAGDDPAGLVARAQAALIRGDTDAALAAWSKLPAPAQDASRAFGDAASARAKAQAAAAALLAAAIDELASGKDASCSGC